MGGVILLVVCATFVPATVGLYRLAPTHPWTAFGGLTAIVAAALHLALGMNFHG